MSQNWYPDTCSCGFEMHYEGDTAVCDTVLNCCNNPVHEQIYDNDPENKQALLDHVMNVQRVRSQAYTIIEGVAGGDFNWYMNGDRMQVELSALQIIQVTIPLTTAGLITLLDLIQI